MGLSLKLVSRGLRAVNPVRIGEGIMANVIKNMLISVLKGLLATLATALVAALAAFEHVVPTATDPYTIAIWGAIITAVHTLGTFIQHKWVDPAPKA